MGTFNDIREPIQKRSIEKKEKIISVGFDLICKNGYYNINTAQIAKAAGVSTGIIYQYFKDKHDILVEGIKKYSKDIFYPMLNITDKTFDKNEIGLVIKNMIDSFIKTHKLSQSAHEEITAMIHSDKEIAEFFEQNEIEMTKQVANLLINNGFNDENLLERVHIAINVIDDLCHEIVYHKHSDLNYDVMKDNVIALVVNLLK